MSPNPFAVLGLPERPDLDDETVRAAWRAIAAATHPDRADGGDLARYTQATAAYAELRTPWGRSEAYADLAEQARREGRYDDGAGPGTEPLPAIPAVAGQAALRPFSPWRLLFAVVWLPSRIGRGRPLRLLIRAAIAACALAGRAGPDPRPARRPGRRRRPDHLVRADRPQGPRAAARTVRPNGKAERKGRTVRPTAR